MNKMLSTVLDGANSSIQAKNSLYPDDTQLTFDIDELCQQTRFTRPEIKFIYRDFKLVRLISNTATVSLL